MFNSVASKNKLYDYPIAAYLLLIQPHEALSEQIVAIKNQFAAQYELPAAIKSKPHITLVKFTQYQHLEERICQQLRRLTMHQTPFLIELQDYGSFPTHTIYIHVATRSPIETLVKNIRTEMQASMKLNNDHKPHFILNPHISIAHKLKPWQYEKAWLQYANSFFSAKFIANNIVLLRKAEDAERYTLAERFEFRGIPIRASQTSLF